MAASKVLVNQSIGAGVTVTSPVMAMNPAVEGTVVIVAPGTFDFNLQVSPDGGATWANLSAGGENVAGLGISGGAIGNYALAFRAPGVTAVRVLIKNTTAGPLTYVVTVYVAGVRV